MAIPLPDSKTQTILDAFMHNWLSLYGVSTQLTTDRGSQFLSKEWKNAMTFLGIHHIHTTAYHPQSNGLAERTIQTIKKSLKTLLEDSNWYFFLPLTMLALRALVKEDLDSTDSEIVFGTQLRLPGEFFTKTQKQTQPTSKFVETQKIFLSKKNIANHVFQFNAKLT